MYTSITLGCFRMFNTTHIQEARSLQGKLNSATASVETSLTCFRYFFKGSQNSCLHLFGNIPSGVTRYITSQSPVGTMVPNFKQQPQKQNMNILQYSCFQIYNTFKWNIFLFQFILLELCLNFTDFKKAS